MAVVTNPVTGHVRLSCSRSGCPGVFVSRTRPVEEEEISRIFDEARAAGWSCSRDVGGPDFCPVHKEVVHVKPPRPRRRVKR